MYKREYTETRRRELIAIREELGMRQRMDLSARTGDRFGSLVIESGEGRYRHCRCDCGRPRDVLAWRLVHGEVDRCHWCMQVRRVQKRGHVVRMAG